MQYKDFMLKQNSEGKAAEYTGTNALILGVRNILLSRPGNFPFNPSLGMDIEKYNFDFLDEPTIENIRSELESQIEKYLPDLGLVEVSVERVEDDGNVYLGIRVGSGKTNANFLIKQNENSLDIANEII